MRRTPNLLGGVWLLVVLAGCATQNAPVPDEVKDYTRPLPPGARALELITDPSEYPDFEAMFASRKGALEAIENSLDWFAKPSSRTFYPFEDFTHERVRRSLERLREILRTAETGIEFNGYVHLEFDVYRSVGWDGSGTVLFTAYCQPIFEGRRQRDAVFRYPLYRQPPDLVKDPDGTPRGRRDGERIVPYYSRREIDGEGLLAGQSLELVWLKSPLDAFIVHVQGSAQIRLPDGETMYVGYAGKTDRPYTSIGRLLVERGEIPAEDISLSSIQNWCARHPDRVQGLLDENESYVFFTETPPGGPFGSLGVAVTPYHTVATDKSIFPRGAPGAMVSELPRVDAVGHKIGSTPFAAIVCDQDTGGAIRSAGRADLFLGAGDAAQSIAGHTKSEGRLYYLFLKERRAGDTSAP